MILTAGFSRRNGRVAAEIAGFGGSGYCRAAMIFGREILPVLSGQRFVLRLLSQRSGVLLVSSRFFLRRRARRHSALPVEGSVILIHDHGLVVDVGHVGDTDVGDGAVVVEPSTAPFAA